MTYSIINRSEIPPTPPSKQERYGEWLAMARHMKILPVDKAVCVEIGQLNAASVAVSIYCAARRVGIKVSTMRVGEHIYAVRTGLQEPLMRIAKKVTCKHCEQVFKTTKPKQAYCRASECQAARSRNNSRDLRARLRRPN